MVKKEKKMLSYRNFQQVDFSELDPPLIIQI